MVRSSVSGIKFEMLLKCLEGDVKKAAGSNNLEFQAGGEYLGVVSSGGGDYLSLDAGLVHLAKESREEKKCEHPAGSISTGRGQGVEEEDAKETLVGKPPDPVSDLPGSQLGRASKPVRCGGHSVGLNVLTGQGQI